jgi:hypothetical protein
MSDFHKENARKFYNFSEANWTEKEYWEDLTEAERESIYQGRDKIINGILCRDSINLLAWNFRFDDELTKKFMDEYWTNHEKYPRYDHNIMIDFIKDYLVTLGEDFDENDLHWVDHEDMACYLLPDIDAISYRLARKHEEIVLIEFNNSMMGGSRGYCVCFGDTNDLIDMYFRLRCPKCHAEYSVDVLNDDWQLETPPDTRFFEQGKEYASPVDNTCPFCETELEVVNY